MAWAFTGQRVLEPAQFIDAVDVEIAVAASAGPEEAVEPLDLIEDFAEFLPVSVPRQTSRLARGGGRSACMMMSPISPCLTRSTRLPAGHAVRHMSPTPTLRFFFVASSASFNILLVVGPSTVTGFSMKTLMPLAMA